MNACSEGYFLRVMHPPPRNVLPVLRCLEEQRKFFFPRKLFLIELHKPTSLKRRKEENNLIKGQSLQPFIVHYVQCGQPELISSEMKSLTESMFARTSCEKLSNRSRDKKTENELKT